MYVCNSLTLSWEVLSLPSLTHQKYNLQKVK